MEIDDIFSGNITDNLNKYFPYLMEIRKRLLFIAAIFLISGIFGFFYYERVIVFLFKFLNLGGINVVFTSPFQFFTLAVNSGFVIGLMVAFPLIIYQVLSFIRPALTEREYKLIIFILPLTILLFIGGFIFGVFVMKYVVAIFYQKSLELQIGNILDIELLLSKIMMTGTLMGIAFQFPIVMTVLLRLKVVKYKAFVKQRIVFYLGAVLFVMLLPPTDLMSDVILTLPLVILFELTLLLNRFLLKSHLL